MRWSADIFYVLRRVVDNRAARSNRACAIRRDHKIFKTAHWSRIDRALIAHWSRMIAYWSRIDRALIAHFWSRLIAHWSRIDRALIAPDRALIAHWSRIFCAINARSGAIRRDQAKLKPRFDRAWSRMRGWIAQRDHYIKNHHPPLLLKK